MFMSLLTAYFIIHESLAQNAFGNESPNLRGSAEAESETSEHESETSEQGEIAQVGVFNLTQDEVFITEGLVNFTMDGVESMVGANYGHACSPHYNRANFAENLKSCAIHSSLRARGTGVCMQHKQHVSYECGQCMGRLMVCGKQCIRQCCSGTCLHDHKCKQCNVDRGCNAAFRRCAGVSAP